MSTLVSTRGRYALRAMADLAEHRSDGFVPLAEVAQRQHISEKYLESIVTTLSRAGLIVGQRGKGGGYRLARDPASYSVGSILRLVEGSLASVACLDAGCGEPCALRDSCRTLPMWEELDRLIGDFFESRTLQDLVDQGAGRPRGDDPCPAAPAAPDPGA